ncbi:tRNA Leu mC34,mU34 2'-O-methyltransferase [Erysipelotrichaceae bacterium]|nr:tRNA Leu mC34,mU34 2'-O-methyltransferase [Erysipelotrichaceae bacterium]
MIHIVLFEPEIPQNTGNIMRTCVATGAKLHLIEPLGFSLDEKHLRRAAMDYYEHISYKTYQTYADFIAENKPQALYFFTRYGKKNHTEMDYAANEDIYFMFGKESKGIPKEILADNVDMCMRIPMNDKVRSLNLSNCAAILVYEALRQRGFEGLSLEEPENFKGKDWLLK